MADSRLTNDEVKREMFRGVNPDKPVNLRDFGEALRGKPVDVGQFLDCIGEASSEECIRNTGYDRKSQMPTYQVDKDKVADRYL